MNDRAHDDRSEGGFCMSVDMTLVMFDVDGTLTESCSLDASTYLDALRDEFDFHGVSDDWATYQHVTDAGIFDEVFRARRKRAPTDEERARMQACFVEKLAARLARAGGLPPIAGAAEMFARLRGLPGYAVSYASGGWGASARLKLRSAGFPTMEVPGAFSDDAISREEICRISRQRAETHYERTFTRVVYVGDGVWDVRTSYNLGYEFIGVGQEAGAEKLRAAGAIQVQRDFQDQEAFLARLTNTS